MGLGPRRSRAASPELFPISTSVTQLLRRRETFQSFWHGGELNPQEWACIKSFLAAGHNFVLYSYQRPKVPRGTILKSADAILSRDHLFDWHGNWQPFSNIFRYALLEKKGGWWVDTDVVCIGKPIPRFEIAFAEQEATVINNGQMKFPKRHPVLRLLRDRAEKIGANQQIWGESGPRLLTQLIDEEGLRKHQVDRDLFYPVHWLEIHKFWLPEYCSEILRRSKDSVGLHLWSSARLGIPKDLQPPAGSYLALLYKKYPFHQKLRSGTQSEYDDVLRSIEDWLSSDVVKEWSIKLGIPVDQNAVRPSRLSFGNAPADSEVGRVKDLFDDEWYLSRYPDVAKAELDPWEHYLQTGSIERRDPNPLFDCDWYSTQSLDAFTADTDLAMHYLDHGAADGLNPSPHFDSDGYLDRYPDVQEAGMNPLVHYLRYGAAEGRKPNNYEESGDKILSLYRRFPALRAAEYVNPKLEARLFLLRDIPKGSVGAELGVFTGRFAREIKKIAEPSLFYLVDPWWKEYGEFYPDWGEYTDNGRLPTQAAYNAALARCSDCCVVVDRSYDWLQTLDDHSLDFVYLDSTHEHDDTLRELFLIEKKLRPSGLILGDDWIPEAGHAHHGVFTAVHDFIASTRFRLVYAGIADQWMLKRTD